MTEEMCIERFRNVSAMIRYHNDKMIEAFARFVRFSVLIVAGSFYVFLEGGGRSWPDNCRHLGGTRAVRVCGCQLRGDHSFQLVFVARVQAN